MVYSNEVVYDVIRLQWWGVLQICDLENDGMNCSIVIKISSVRVVHGLQSHRIGLVQHLGDAVWT